MECLLSCDSVLNPFGYCIGECFTECPNICRILLVDGADMFPPSYFPPPPPADPSEVIRPNVEHDKVYNHQKHPISTSIIIVACLLGATLIVGILSMVFRAYYNRQRNPRRTRSSPMVFGTQEDFFDEDQGPVIDHPIWYINTVGFPQPVIDSIAAFRYRKGEGLVEGTDCSVCLSEFQEDETLRLLPKCSHAFHLPCIDTWLRSHKNCPLCRAPIVSENFDVHVDVLVPTTGSLGSSEEPQMGNFDGSNSGSGLISNPEGEDGVSEVRIMVGNGSTVGSTLEEETHSGRLKLDLDYLISRDQFRVGSDLVENREDVGTEMQPRRRSVSLDYSSSALAIYNAVSQVIPGKDHGNRDAQQTKHSRVKRVDKRGSTGSLSFRKLMKSSSIGRSLQRGPVSMKRTFSSSGKSSLSLSSRDMRSQDSFLPL